jgi:hypothetical protein
MNMLERPDTIPATMWFILAGYKDLSFGVAFDLDVLVNVVLDDGWCGFRDVIEGPGFNRYGILSQRG